MRQIAKRKEVFHGGWSLCFFPSAFPLVVTQSCKLPLKNKVLTSLAPSWAQKFLSILQSLSTWIIDSGSKRYKGHVRSTCTPPPPCKALLNADAITQTHPHKGLNTRDDVSFPHPLARKRSDHFLTPSDKLICTFKLKASMSGYTLS